MSAIAKKLAVVFGVGSKIGLNVAGKEAVASDGNTTVILPTKDFETKPEDGVYDLVLTSETEYEQTLRIPGAAAVKAKAEPAKNPKPAGKQSPSIGFEKKMLR